MGCREVAAGSTHLKRALLLTLAGSRPAAASPGTTRRFLCCSRAYFVFRGQLRAAAGTTAASSRAEADRSTAV